MHAKPFFSQLIWRWNAKGTCSMLSWTFCRNKNMIQNFRLSHFRNRNSWMLVTLSKDILVACGHKVFKTESQVSSKLFVFFLALSYPGKQILSYHTLMLMLFSLFLAFENHFVQGEMQAVEVKYMLRRNMLSVYYCLHV